MDHLVPLCTEHVKQVEEIWEQLNVIYSKILYEKEELCQKTPDNTSSQAIDEAITALQNNIGENWLEAEKLLTELETVYNEARYEAEFKRQRLDSCEMLTIKMYLDQAKMHPLWNVM